MDPHHPRAGSSQGTGGHAAAEGPDRGGPGAGAAGGAGGAGAAGAAGGADRQPRHSDGFTMIPPDESRRSRMTMMAQREEEELRRWKETHRVPSVNLEPERLGGDGSLAEARQRQLADLRFSKVQKKLRQEELDRRRRKEEEAKQQRMKAEQREKAERLEERNRQDEQGRREQFQQDHLRTTERFLQSFERRAPGPLASSGATHTSSGNQAVETKQRENREKSVRDVQRDHKRRSRVDEGVNSAFLDRLEGRGGGGRVGARASGASGDSGGSGASGGSGGSEGSGDRATAAATLWLPSAHLGPDPERSGPGGTGDAAEPGADAWDDPEPDYDWALMKLMTNFPDCSRVFLEDILDQCGGDYDQAYALLVWTCS